MVEEQDKLKIEIGTVNSEKGEKLNPKPVKVLGVEIKPVTYGDKQWDSIVLSVKHPDNETPIQINKVKYEKEGKLKVVSLSLSYDKEGKISKISALASLLKNYGANNLEELRGKELNTVADEKGYLCFKAY